MITYPDIKTDITLDYGLTDIVAERFDAGVRLGEDVDKDMIALRISPDIPMTIVGASSYFDKYPIPVQPQELVKHQCINLRLSTSRGHYVWPFRKGNRELKVRVNGPAAFNSITMILDAVLDGFGLAFLPLDQVQEDLASGRLVRVLEDWTPCFPGYHLYYPSRRQLTPAFALLVKAFRDRLSR